MRRRNMASSGTGFKMSPQDARDLLKKWMTESTKIQGLLVTSNGFRASTLGTLIPSADGGVAVVLDRKPPLTTFLEFKLSRAEQFKYGDTRAFPPGAIPEVGGDPTLLSGLTIVFPDGSLVALFEVPEWN
jgi:hypothetical protein